MYIMSSGDGGATWDFEHDVFLATDMREPRLLGYDGFLQLMFFEAGSDSGQFTPVRMWRTRRLGPAQWSDLELLTDAGEVPWDLKIHDGIAYRTSYMGDHYGSGETSDVSVFFKQSTDGTTWTNVGGREHVYFGGVSEVAFDFDRDGRLWAVTRNEDGDGTGFGSHVCTAPPDDLSNWDCPTVNRSGSLRLAGDVPPRRRSLPAGAARRRRPLRRARRHPLARRAPRPLSHRLLAAAEALRALQARPPDCGRSCT